MEVLGIDIGGSGIKGAIVDVEKGEFVGNRFRVDTPQPAKPEPVFYAIEKIVDHFQWKGLIGGGFPGVIKHGVVYTAANLHPKSWSMIQIDQGLTKLTGCKCCVINDADAAGIAEMRLGAGKDRNQGVVMMITLGTGIGTAIFVNGQLLPNVEFGHIEIRGKDAEKRASSGIKDEKKLGWEEWGERLNEYFLQVEKLLSPDLFIIGGGISKQYEEFFKYIHTEAEMIPARFYNNAGIIGAACIAAETLV